MSGYRLTVAVTLAALFRDVERRVTAKLAGQAQVTSARTLVSLGESRLLLVSDVPEAELRARLAELDWSWEWRLVCTDHEKKKRPLGAREHDRLLARPRR